MNIFKEKKDFIGLGNVDTEDNSFYSLFSLAKQIRTKLGEQGYLLDYYLSIFFRAVRSTSASDAATDGFQATVPYQGICMSVLDNSKKLDTHPLYEKTLVSAIGEFSISSYRENTTQLEMLFSAIADDYFADALNKYRNREITVLNSAVDEIQLQKLYEQITHQIGESHMETLNLKLKQKFLVAPITLIFMQGFIDNFLYRLTSRDIQSSKQIFQLILDSIAEKS